MRKNLLSQELSIKCGFISVTKEDDSLQINIVGDGKNEGETVTLDCKIDNTGAQTEISKEAEKALIKTIQQMAVYAECQPQMVDSLSTGIYPLMKVISRF